MKRRLKKAFTLIETILAALILCGLVLTVSSICIRSSQATLINRQYEDAANIAERQLSIVDYLGVDGFLDIGKSQGDIDSSGKTYHWQISTEPLDLTGLYAVKADINWTERKQLYNVSITTRINDYGRAIDQQEQQ